MSEADAVAAVLWIGVTMYAVFGGADFGAGLWNLFARGGEGGKRPRDLIDWAIGPVWEANHVWLIFTLVVLWTGFPSAFEAVFSTLFIPLSLAALGIVVRGAGFAFHRTARRFRGRLLAERLFGNREVQLQVAAGEIGNRRNLREEMFQTLALEPIEGIKLDLDQVLHGQDVRALGLRQTCIERCGQRIDRGGGFSHV